MADPQVLTPEEMQAFTVLLKNRRLMVQIIPEGTSEEFCKRLTTWVNFVLDTKLLPPMAVIATRTGDGLTCPFCNAGIDANFPNRNFDQHSSDCDWRRAMERWAFANVEIDRPGIQ